MRTDQQVAQEIAYLDSDPYIASLISRKRRNDDRALAAFSFVMGAVVGGFWAFVVTWLCVR